MARDDESDSSDDDDDAAKIEDLEKQLSKLKAKSGTAKEGEGHAMSVTDTRPTGSYSPQELQLLVQHLRNRSRLE